MGRRERRPAGPAFGGPDQDLELAFVVGGQEVLVGELPEHLQLALGKTNDVVPVVVDAVEFGEIWRIMSKNLGDYIVAWQSPDANGYGILTRGAITRASTQPQSGTRQR